MQLIGELRWYYNEMKGELGLRSNFMSIVNKLSGFYGAADPNSNIDGRILAAASRAKKVARGLARLQPDQSNILYLYTIGHPEEALMPIIINSKDAQNLHKKSRSRKPFEEWCLNLVPKKDCNPDDKRTRLWLKLKAEATRKLERCLSAFRLHYGE